MIDSPSTLDVNRQIALLLDQYGGRIRHILREHPLAAYGVDHEDVIQEIRIRLWQALRRAEDAPAQRAEEAPAHDAVITGVYIQRVVATVAIDHLRRAQSRHQESQVSYGGSPDDGGCDPELDAILAEASSLGNPERNAQQHQTMQHLDAVLRQLPARRAKALSLHLQGYSQAEIGLAVGVSEESARKLIARGLVDFRKHWGPDENQPRPESLVRPSLAAWRAGRATSATAAPAATEATRARSRPSA